MSSPVYRRRGEAAYIMRDVRDQFGHENAELPRALRRIHDAQRKVAFAKLVEKYKDYVHDPNS